MQETFDHLASLICENDPDMIEKLEEIEMLKKNKMLRQVKKSDSESVYEMIKEEVSEDQS